MGGPWKVTGSSVGPQGASSLLVEESPGLTTHSLCPSEGTVSGTETEPLGLVTAGKGRTGTGGRQPWACPRFSAALGTEANTHRWPVSFFHQPG